MMNANTNNTYVLSGTELYNLLIEGFIRKYNRRLGSREDYKICMQEMYNFFLSLIDSKTRKKFIKKHKNWSKVNFPIQLMMVHNHKDGVECEPHYRIMVGQRIFDIPKTSKLIEYKN